MPGIHKFVTRPVPVLAAVWDPEDEWQRVAVLGWLSAYYGESDPFEFEYGLNRGGLHLVFDSGRSYYFAPGDAIVMNPETGELAAFNEANFNVCFDHEYAVIDPMQRAIFQFLDLLAEV